jgi:hypothetical protein
MALLVLLPAFRNSIGLPLCHSLQRSVILFIGSLPMKKTALILLQISGYLILLGGLLDFLAPFFSNALPASHLRFLKLKNELTTPGLTNLDHALLGAIGGCLIGVGIGSLTITYTSLSKNNRPALLGLLAMITISEGINASQIFVLSAPYFVFPLLCVLIAWLGAVFLWKAYKKV